MTKKQMDDVARIGNRPSRFDYQDISEAEKYYVGVCLTTGFISSSIEPPSPPSERTYGYEVEDGEDRSEQD